MGNFNNVPTREKNSSPLDERQAFTPQHLQLLLCETDFFNLYILHNRESACPAQVKLSAHYDSYTNWCNIVIVSMVTACIFSTSRGGVLITCLKDPAPFFVIFFKTRWEDCLQRQIFREYVHSFININVIQNTEKIFLDLIVSRYLYKGINSIKNCHFCCIN